MIRISLNVKSQGTKNIEVFFQGLCILPITNTSFVVLDIKLWLEEDSAFDTDHPLYLFKFIQSKAQNVVIV